MAKISHGKVSLKITYNNNIWGITKLLHAIGSLPGIHKVEVDHLYKSFDVEVSND